MESESESPIALNIMAERCRFAAPGFAGGGDGGRGDVKINGRTIDNRIQHILVRGDTILVRTPGGGGWGDPIERPASLRRRDRLMGYVGSRRAARRTPPQPR